MRAPAIVPTITQRVRTFLAGQGAALRPWTGLEETYDEFYALLRRRRDDPEFWQPLKGLLRDVVASAVDAQKARRPVTAQAELLSSWKVDELVDELRDALVVGGNSAGPARRDFTRKLSSAVLGGFLLLGLAASGCGDDSNPGGTGGTGGSGAGGTVAVDAKVGGAGGATGAGGTATSMGGAVATGGMAGASGTGGAIGTGGAGGMDGGLDAAELRDTAAEAMGSVDAPGVDGVKDGSPSNDVASEAGLAAACSQTVATELDQAIGESSLSTSQKSQLCQCFASLSTAWTTSLTQLFATATPEKISTMLQNLTSCCQPSGMMTRNGTNGGPTATDLQYVENGPGYMICAVPVYKGVSFPD